MRGILGFGFCARVRGTLAGCAVTVHQHLDGTLSLSYGPHCLGRYDERGGALGHAKRAAVEKPRGGKVKKPIFPPRLEIRNPAKCAGFPLSHRPGGCWRLTKPDISLATKSGHFHLLTTVAVRG
jgi:hypothetical protein